MLPVAERIVVARSGRRCAALPRRPLDSTLSAAYYIYQKFGFGQYGIASAASWVLFIIIALVSVLQSRILKED